MSELSLSAGPRQQGSGGSFPDPFSPIQVTVTPSQSAYFAGEPFSVTISFTNTRSPEAPAPRSASTSASFTPSHRRFAHSISSAPLAKPPTSPGIAKLSSSFNTSTPPSRLRNDNALQRRGLIGFGKDRTAEEAASKRRGQSRSLSVSITPELVKQLVESETEKPKVTKSPIRRVIEQSIDPPSSPRTSSPLARSPSLPPSHPHARKNSVQVEHSQQEELVNYGLSLKPITESNSPIPPSTPTFPSPRPDLVSLYPDPARRPSDRLPTSIPNAKGPGQSQMPPGANNIGIGPPPGSVGNMASRTAFSSAFSIPGTELLLWAYAQLAGTLEFDETHVSLESLKDLQSKLRRGGAVGGGSMDITSAPMPSVMSQSRSRGLFGFFSPSTQSSSPAIDPRSVPYRNSRSFLTGVTSLLASGAATSLGQGVNSEVGSNAVPTLDGQRDMLITDLSLAPGESRSYTYTVALPAVLPPTFRGRALKFSYNLTIGTCRSPGSSSSERETQLSRVMKVPIRIYNNVSVGRPQRPYDLLWPVARRRVETTVEANLPGVKLKNTLARNCTLFRFVTTASELEKYGRVLLADNQDERSAQPAHDDTLDEEAFSGCRESVVALTRYLRKVSYEVGKSGQKVAVVTLVKSAYRLGETVLGVVDFNSRDNRARVLKFSAMLEAQESLPSSLVVGPTQTQSLRRVFAEHHAGLVLDTTRTSFSLDIPSDAAPSFQLQPSGGLVWKVKLCFLVSVASESADPESDVRHLTEDGLAGEWGSAFWASRGLAPMERTHSSDEGKSVPGSWSSIFASPFLGEPLEDGEMWDELGIEKVECEVPVHVWPGNTAFRPVDVVFEV